MRNEENNGKTETAAAKKGRFSTIKKVCLWVLSVFKYFLTHQLAFAALCAVVVVIMVAHNAHRLGISLFPQTTKISVSSPYFQQGMSFWESGDYIQAEENLLLALEDVRKKKSDDELETAEVMQKLGALYLAMQQYSKSYDLLNSAYVTFQKKLGAQDGKTIITVCQRATCDLSTGYAERALAALSDAYDETNSMQYKMQIAQMIAQAYMALGDYKRADGFYQLLFQFYGDRNEMNTYVLNLWNDYGVMLMTQGEYVKGLSVLKTAESNWENIPEGERVGYPGTLSNIYGNEAMAYAYLNRPQEAAEYVERVLGMNGADISSPEVANAYLTAANVYDILGEEENSLNSLEKALSAALDSAGENSALTASIYRTLAVYYYKAGKLDLAIENDKKVLEIERNILAEQEYGTALAYQALCEDYNKTGDYDQSIEHGLKAVEICEERFRRDNPLTGKAYTKLSWPYLNSGDRETARFYAELAVDICDRHLPEIDNGRADAHLALACVYWKLERFQECFGQFQQAIELYRAAFGDGCFSIAEAQRELGNARLDSGDYPEAETAYQAALSIYRQLTGPYGEYIAVTGNSLGLSAYYGGALERALDWYADAETDCKRAIREDGENKDLQELLASIYNNIAAVREKQERYEDAAEAEFKAYRILTENALDYRDSELIAQRIDRLHQRLAPDVPLEVWLMEGSEKNNVQ